MAAAAELAEACHWYESEKPGLEKRFHAEITRLEERILDNPLQFFQTCAPTCALRV